MPQRQMKEKNTTPTKKQKPQTTTNGQHLAHLERHVRDWNVEYFEKSQCQFSAPRRAKDLDLARTP